MESQFYLSHSTQRLIFSNNFGYIIYNKIFITNNKYSNMKTLLIFNPQSIDSLLCKHIVLALFPNSNEFTFLSLPKSEKFRYIDTQTTLEHDKFIFIETYPTLDWFNTILSTPNNNKTIEVYATYDNGDYTFDNDYARLHLPDTFSKNNTLANKFIRQNFNHITQENLIVNNQQPYNNRELILSKFESNIKLFVSVGSYNDTMRLLDSEDNVQIANLIIANNLQSIVNFTKTYLKHDYIKNAQIKHYQFNDNDVFEVDYLSVLNQDYKTQDNIIKTINWTLIETNNISFLEYVKHLDNLKVQLTFVATNKDILLGPNYENQFNGVDNEIKQVMLIDYLCANYEFTPIDFSNMVTVTNDAGYTLSFNWDNSVTVQVPIDVYLAIKNSQEIQTIQ